MLLGDTATHYSPRVKTWWDGRVTLTYGRLGVTLALALGRFSLMLGVDRADENPWVALGARADGRGGSGLELNCTMDVSKAQAFLYASWRPR